MRSHLPAINFPAKDTGLPVEPRSGRGPLVLVVAHAEMCDACSSYERQLSAADSTIGEWGGRVVSVTDPEGKLLAHAPGVIIADEWGEIYFETEGGAEHALPDPDEVAEWVRFIAIQCPECEQPEGEWRTL